MRIICVVGTRPNIIKMASLYREIRDRENIIPYIIHTGQHQSKRMSEVFFKELNLPKPDVYLNVFGGSHAFQTGEIIRRLEPHLIDISPDLVIVVGDVNSTLAASIVSVQCKIPLAHIEAGLRSKDRSMPEEINRIIVDQLSDYLFVTEQSGIDNLINEGISAEKIFFVGNILIDTLITFLEKAKKSNILKRLGLIKNNYALVTLHRPSNTDDIDVLKEIITALNEISNEIPILFPIHPRTKKQIMHFDYLINISSNIKMVEPLGYIDFLNAMYNSKVVFTDSGGIQEETTILGVPCLTIRNNTERPITISCGTNTLVGTTYKKIIHSYEAIPELYNKQTNPPLWDSQASKRIVDILEEQFHRNLSTNVKSVK